ncbi:MAG: hypothetical protein K2H38_10670 [Muribaculaceae bacterium]|nr:hypothetical protein [Muribaculaceae bacterium]
MWAEGITKRLSEAMYGVSAAQYGVSAAQYDGITSSGRGGWETAYP